MDPFKQSESVDIASDIYHAAARRNLFYSNLPQILKMYSLATISLLIHSTISPKTQNDICLVSWLSQSPDNRKSPQVSYPDNRLCTSNNPTSAVLQRSLIVWYLCRYKFHPRLFIKKAPPFSALLLRPKTIELALGARSFPIRATTPLLLQAKQMQKFPQVNHIDGSTSISQEVSIENSPSDKSRPNWMLVSEQFRPQLNEITLGIRADQVRGWRYSRIECYLCRYGPKQQPRSSSVHPSRMQSSTCV